MFPPSSILRCAGLAISASLGFIVYTGALIAFESPNFSTELFDRDGLFLSKEENDGVLSALSALSSNFPDDPLVDDNLREMALALALRINPMHHESRMVLQELNQGITPTPSAFFESLSSVSEMLWTTGKHLITPPINPEGKRLAPYLMELSLLIHPQWTEDRLLDFATVCGEAPPDWKGVVKLHPNKNPTAAKVMPLFREARNLFEKHRRAEMIAAKEAAKEAAKASPENLGTPKAKAELPPLQPVTVSMDSVLAELVSDPASLVLGTLTLRIQPPANGQERRLVRNPSEALPDLPIYVPNGGFPFLPPTIPSAFAASRQWHWPERGVGELSFASPAPPAPLKASPVLPSLVLIESALSGNPVNKDYLLLGEFNPESMVIGIAGSVIAQIEKAHESGVRYLLIPEIAFEPLIASLQTSDQLGILFHPEIISYRSIDDVLVRMTSPVDPGLTEASSLFAEIEDASKRMALPELARHQIAQEKLQNLINVYPSHLSARVMKEYGSRPLDTRIQIQRFTRKLDQVMEPFLELTSKGEPFNDTVRFKDPFNETSDAFLKLRQECPQEARSVLTAAGDVVSSTRSFIEMSNKESSMAMQRYDAANSMINNYRNLRNALTALIQNPAPVTPVQ